MDHVIRLHSDPHSNAEALLPWYVSGQLDAAERAELEAHLAEAQTQGQRVPLPAIHALPQATSLLWQVKSRDLRDVERASSAP